MEVLPCWPDVARIVLTHALAQQPALAPLMSPEHILAAVAKHMSRYSFAALPLQQSALIPAGVSAILEYHRLCLEAGDCRSKDDSSSCEDFFLEPEDEPPEDVILIDSFAVYFRQLYLLLQAAADSSVLISANCDSLTEIADALETLFPGLVGMPGMMQDDVDRVLAAVTANMSRAMREKYGANPS